MNQFTVNKFCNLGYWVISSKQRMGAATAATLALRELALEKLGQAHVEIVVADGNEPSLAVARRAGASYEGIARSRLQLHGHAINAHVFAFTHD